MAEGMARAHLALEPRRVMAQRRRHLVDDGEALASSDRLLGDGLIVADPLGVDPIIVLAHRDVDGAGETSQGHADLHLSVVERLGVLHTLLHKFFKAIFIMRFDF
jgi:hypothetical protein